MSERLKINNDPKKRIIEIEGIRYAYDFFKMLGEDGVPVGQVVKIDSRTDGVITVSMVTVP